jgi:transketolase N-terminal domain/subunit
METKLVEFSIGDRITTNATNTTLPNQSGVVAGIRNDESDGICYLVHWDDGETYEAAAWELVPRGGSNE